MVGRKTKKREAKRAKMRNKSNNNDLRVMTYFNTFGDWVGSWGRARGTPAVAGQAGRWRWCWEEMESRYRKIIRVMMKRGIKM